MGRWIDLDAEAGSTEVTQGEFEATMGYNSSFNTACGANCPVEKVSWFEALAYANELSVAAQLTPCFTFLAVTCRDGTSAGTDYMSCASCTPAGIQTAEVELNAVTTPYACTGYRLPTEAEWEYLARAGSLTPFYPSDGNDGSIADGRTDYVDPNLNQVAWYDGNNWPTGAKEVARKEANAWGLHDMSGNVFEWVLERLQTYSPGSTAFPLEDPWEAQAFDSLTRVVRGGHYSAMAKACRSGTRNFATANGEHQPGLPCGSYDRSLTGESNRVAA